MVARLPARERLQAPQIKMTAIEGVKVSERKGNKKIKKNMVKKKKKLKGHLVFKNIFRGRL